MATDARFGDRFDCAMAAIDGANAEDPTRLVVDGVARPKEVVHAEMVTAWVQRLRPDAPEALLLAARAHHLRRWTVPRNSYPAGRSGYLRWRRELHRRHADDLAVLLAQCGYDDATTARAGAIVRKEGLAAGDADVQALEDSLCLVVLATQLGDVAARLDEAKMLDVLAKTAKKMSPAGLALVAELPLDPAGMALLARALG
jgi:hypothetical protein